MKVKQTTKRHSKSKLFANIYVPTVFHSVQRSVLYININKLFGLLYPSTYMNFYETILRKSLCFTHLALPMMIPMYDADETIYTKHFSLSLQEITKQFLC